MPQLPSKPQDVEGAVGRQRQGQRSWAMPIACCAWNKMSRQTRVLPIKSPAKADSSVRSVRAPLPNRADSFRKSFPNRPGCSLPGVHRMVVCGRASGAPCQPQACRRHTSPGKGWATASHCLAVCRSVQYHQHEHITACPCAHHQRRAVCPCRFLHRALLHLSGGDSCGARMLVQNCAAIFTLPSSSRSWRPPSRACACAARAPACTSTAGCP